MPNSNLPEWAQGLVSDDIEWTARLSSVVTCIPSIIQITVAPDAHIRIDEDSDEDEVAFRFPSPKAAIQVAEGFIRGLMS